MSRLKTCHYCDEKITKDQDFFIDPYVDWLDNKNKPIHQDCYYSRESDDMLEPELRVKPIGKNNPDFEDLEFSYLLRESNYDCWLTVGNYHDMTDGLFNFTGHYDNWRGYTQPTSEYVEIEDNHLTMGYGNDQELIEQRDRIESIVKDNNLRGAIVLSRTSNCLSQGIGYWIHKDDLDKFNELNQKVIVAQ